MILKMSFNQSVQLKELEDFIKGSKEGLEADKKALENDEMSHDEYMELRGMIRQRQAVIKSLERILAIKV